MVQMYTSFFDGLYHFKIMWNTRNRSVVVSNPFKGSSCFLEQKTLPLLLSTDSNVISQSNLNELRALWNIHLSGIMLNSLNMAKTKCNI